MWFSFVLLNFTISWKSHFKLILRYRNKNSWNHERSHEHHPATKFSLKNDRKLNYCSKTKECANNWPDPKFQQNRFKTRFCQYFVEKHIWSGKRLLTVQTVWLRLWTHAIWPSYDSQGNFTQLWSNHGRHRHRGPSYKTEHFWLNGDLRDEIAAAYYFVRFNCPHQNIQEGWRCKKPNRNDKWIGLKIF